MNVQGTKHRFEARHLGHTQSSISKTSLTHVKTEKTDITTNPQDQLPPPNEEKERISEGERGTEDVEMVRMIERIKERERVWRVVGIKGIKVRKAF